MKNSLNKSSQITSLGFLFTSLLLVFLGCEPQDGPWDPPNQIPEKTYKVGPEGGTIKALNGNITIEIPKGALLLPEKFTIQEGPIDDGNDFIIKSIAITPKTVTFNIPVGLSLKYDGQLSCGLDPCKTKSLALYHFQNEPEFDKRRPSDMLWKSKCYVNQMDCCLETTIYTGGVFAIGEESMGQKAPDPS